MPLVFARGTLKRGFPLHEHGLSDARFVGAARTLQAHPLVIAGDRFAPMMLREPGVGKQVAGELFELDTAALAKLDRIESVGEPGNFRDIASVERLDDGTIMQAWIFFKSRALAVPIHSDCLSAYELDARFVPPDHL
jgi:gamma-glutamylaminecyclotransferase